MKTFRYLALVAYPADESYTESVWEIARQSDDREYVENYIALHYRDFQEGKYDDLRWTLVDTAEMPMFGYVKC